MGMKSEVRIWVLPSLLTLRFFSLWKSILETVIDFLCLDFYVMNSSHGDFKMAYPLRVQKRGKDYLFSLRNQLVALPKCDIFD